MSDVAIRISDVSKSFKDIKALDQVSFDVPSNSVFGLLGPNGAGKTTLFSLMANFLRAGHGKVEVLGIDTRQISALQGRMTILPQDAQFQRNVPILEQLTFFRMLDGQPRNIARQEVEEGLERVGLKDYMRRGVHALSHGMVKRLGIAQAFLGSPEVILLDEPTAGLDPANARQIRDLVKQLQSRATTVVSSHNLLEIQELCDHVAILHKGRLINCGAVDDITHGEHQIEMVMPRTLRPEELERLRQLSAVREISSKNAPEYTIHLGRSDGQDWETTVTEILQHLLHQKLVPRRWKEGRSLERHFLELTGDEEEPAPAPS